MRRYALTLLLLLCASMVGAWTPPIGIPYPSLGIDEVRPADPGSWPSSETAGYYYVNNGVACTDSAPLSVEDPDRSLMSPRSAGANPRPPSSARSLT